MQLASDRQKQSDLIHHRRLFTILDLRSFLDDRHRLACQQFVHGSKDSDPHLLVERLLDRFEVEPLKLHEAELRECIEIEDDSLNTSSLFLCALFRRSIPLGLFTHRYRGPVAGRPKV